MSKRVKVGTAVTGSRSAVKRFTSWSFSRWRDYENCPRSAKFKHLDKLPEPKGEALERGSAIHAEAEAYLKTPTSKRAQVPTNLRPLSAEFAKLRRGGAQAEIQLAFSKGWKRVGYFDADVWVRIKIDALLLPEEASDPAFVIDFKTGRYRAEDEKNQMQLDLYGTSILAAYPARSLVEAQLLFTDAGLIVDAEKAYQQSKLPKLRTMWEERVEPMFNDKRFAPKPGPACRWCAFARSKGGPCDLG